MNRPLFTDESADYKSRQADGPWTAPTLVNNGFYLRASINGHFVTAFYSNSGVTGNYQSLLKICRTHCGRFMDRPQCAQLLRSRGKEV